MLSPPLAPAGPQPSPGEFVKLVRALLGAALAIAVAATVQFASASAASATPSSPVHLREHAFCWSCWTVIHE